MHKIWGIAPQKIIADADKVLQVLQQALIASAAFARERAIAGKNKDKKMIIPNPVEGYLSTM